MATATSLSHASDRSASEKTRPYFTVADIENFFETCPEEMLSRRFRHFLRGCWIASGRPFGTDILFFKANKHYAKGCFYKSERTVRYNRVAAEKLGLLEIAHRDDRGASHHIWIRHRTEKDKGLYRRVTTHRLPISLLMRWREDHHRQGQVTPIRKPSTPVPPPLPPAPAAPLPKRAEPAAIAQSEHRSSERSKQPRYATLTRREASKFVTVFDNLMQPKKIGETPVEETPPASAPPANNLWSRILVHLQGKVNRHSFDTWLKPTRYSHVSDDVLFVRVPTAEFRHAGDKYADLICQAIDSLGLEVKDVRFVMPEEKMSVAKYEKMSRNKALEKACALFGISEEHGEEVLRLHGLAPENGK